MNKPSAKVAVRALADEAKKRLDAEGIKYVEDEERAKDLERRKGITDSVTLRIVHEVGTRPSTSIRLQPETRHSFKDPREGVAEIHLMALYTPTYYRKSEKTNRYDWRTVINRIKKSIEKAKEEYEKDERRKRKKKENATKLCEEMGIAAHHPYDEIHVIRDEDGTYDISARDVPATVAKEMLHAGLEVLQRESTGTFPTLLIPSKWVELLKIVELPDGTPKAPQNRWNRNRDNYDTKLPYRDDERIVSRRFFDKSSVAFVLRSGASNYWVEVEYWIPDNDEPAWKSEPMQEIREGLFKLPEPWVAYSPYLTIQDK